ncbi:hypothetical protein C2S53_020652 [Perilla frutescens var. hirtella]|uniref:Uncharacterized protein n=1 Tax=Perilla frutescens var. hirtella TaxID=608512 RepID=A0AAD4PAR9_PERFH|nr:hypothetical protein C2S53_020652 [Perilla frutescens var. hirtella]
MENLDAEAQADLWKYVYGFSELRMVKCAVELGLADVVEKHGRPMMLSELSSAVGCPETTLFRVMRFLNHRGIFKKQVMKNDDASSVCYVQTPLSRLLTRENMGPLVLAQDGPDSHLSVEDLKAGKGSGSEPATADDKIWSPEFGGEEFNRLSDDLITDKGLPRDFSGNFFVGGCGRSGRNSSRDAGPGLSLDEGINFDLPHVVSGEPALDRVHHIGGDMFETIPKGDAVILMSILHDWSDQLSIKILKKCKEAIPVDRGKVIIVDAVLDSDEEERNDEFTGARLAQDMGILIGTVTGKERTAKEWAQLIDAAGSSSHKIKHIKAIESVIVACP